MVVADFRAGLAMQIAVFSARPYDRRFLEEANQHEGAGQDFQFVYFDAALACVRDTPGAATWQCSPSFSGTFVPPCQTELSSLYNCTQS
jgi:hypothetical protein